MFPLEPTYPVHSTKRSLFKIPFAQAKSMNEGTLYVLPLMLGFYIPQLT